MFFATSASFLTGIFRKKERMYFQLLGVYIYIYIFFYPTVLRDSQLAFFSHFIRLHQLEIRERFLVRWGGSGHCVAKRQSWVESQVAHICRGSSSHDSPLCIPPFPPFLLNPPRDFPSLSTFPYFQWFILRPRPLFTIEYLCSYINYANAVNTIYL